MATQLTARTSPMLELDLIYGETKFYNTDYMVGDCKRVGGRFDTRFMGRLCTFEVTRVVCRGTIMAKYIGRAEVMI